MYRVCKEIVKSGSDPSIKCFGWQFDQFPKMHKNMLIENAGTINLQNFTYYLIKK